MSDILFQIEQALTSDSDGRRDEALDAAYIEIVRLRSVLETIAGSTTDRLQEIQARQALPNIGPRS